MTSRDFAFWLNGYLELAGPGVALNAEQTACVQKHLSLVFKHEIDPSAGPAAVQDELNAIHSPIKPAIGGTSPSGAILRC